MNLLIIILSSFFSVVEAAKQVDPQVKEVKSIALKIEEQRYDKERQKQLVKEQKEQALIEKTEQVRVQRLADAQQKREQVLRKEMMLLERKNREQKEACLRLAKEMDAKRRKKIASWRDYMSTKKGATMLTKLVKKVDQTNQLHVTQLRDEVRAFVEKRLHGNVELYPELKAFYCLSK